MKETYVIQFQETSNRYWHTFRTFPRNEEEWELDTLDEAKKELKAIKGYYIRGKKQYRDCYGYMYYITKARIMVKRTVVSYHTLPEDNLK